MNSKTYQKFLIPTISHLKISSPKKKKEGNKKELKYVYNVKENIYYLDS
jgi:hypothetical protein